MDKILVEALKTFRYSPNGWDNAKAEVGEEFYLSKSSVEGQLKLDTPSIRVIDEDFKPIVFSTDVELAEKKLGLDNTGQMEIPIDEEESETEEVVEDIIVDKEDSFLDEIEIEIDTDEDGPESPHTLEELDAKVEASEKGADEIDLGVFFKAIQKSGSWYNVVKKGHEDTILNDKGIGKKELGSFAYDLYLKEV